MNDLHFDTTELRKLAVDLSQAPGRIQRRAPKAMLQGARGIRRAMRKDASGHRYLHKFAQEVNLSRLDGAGLAYEIGFDKSGQGNLANIIVFGSINNASVYDFDSAWRREMPALLQRLAGAGEESVLGGPR